MRQSYELQRGDPRMIQWVPRELRTADLCLYAEAAHPELRVYVPDEIRLNAGKHKQSG